MAVTATIDRFEGEFAVLIEDSARGQKVDVEQALLPEGARAGDVIELSEPLGDGGEEAVLRALSGARLDRQATEERSKHVNARIQRLKNRGGEK